VPGETTTISEVRRKESVMSDDYHGRIGRGSS
jgi:hypothetical protein